MKTDTGNGGRPALGAALILLSGLCWAAYVIMAKIGIEFGLNVVTINTVRLVVGAASIGIYIVVFRKFFSKATPATILLLLVLGAVDYGIGGLLYIASMLYIDASLAFLLVYTFPALVVVFSALIDRERLTLRKVLAVIITFIGVALVLEVGGAVREDAWIGVAFVLSSAFIFAVYILICEGLMSRYTSSQLGFLSIAGGALIMLAVIPFTSVRFDLLSDPRSILIIVLVSIVGTSLAMILFFMGVKIIGATTASIVTTVEPVFVVLLAWLVLGETLSLLQMAGTALLMFGVALVQVGAPAREPGP